MAVLGPCTYYRGTEFANLMQPKEGSWQWLKIKNTLYLGGIFSFTLKLWYHFSELFLHLYDFLFLCHMKVTSTMLV